MEANTQPQPHCERCGWGIDVHRKNGMGHPWQSGARVTEKDLALADEETREAYRKRHQTPLALPQ